MSKANSGTIKKRSRLQHPWSPKSTSNLNHISQYPRKSTSKARSSNIAAILNSGRMQPHWCTFPENHRPLLHRYGMKLMNSSFCPYRSDNPTHKEAMIQSRDPMRKIRDVMSSSHHTHRNWAGDGCIVAPYRFSLYRFCHVL